MTQLVEFSPRPTAPSRKRRSVFGQEGDVFVAWWEVWAGELDQLQIALVQLQTTVSSYKTSAEQAAQTATVKEALMSPHYDDIDTLAPHIDNINTAAADIDNINAVSAKLTQLQTAVDNIGSIVNAAANETNINTVAGIEAAVSAVASVSAELQAVYTNLAEILQADDNAAAAYNSAQDAAQSAQEALNAAAGNIIDDSSTALNKTWSSDKIEELLGGKLAKSSAATVASGVIDATSDDLFLTTITADTTLSVTNLPTEPYGFVLEITNGGSFLVTWWAGITWSSGIPPSLTASGTDILGFYHNDGVWRGFKMSVGAA